MAFIGGHSMAPDAGPGLLAFELLYKPVQNLIQFEHGRALFRCQTKTAQAVI
jgi:hypothetical protein